MKVLDFGLAKMLEPMARQAQTRPSHQPDGERFLVVNPGAPGNASGPQMVVVLNWYEELKRLVPTK